MGIEASSYAKDFGGRCQALPRPFFFVVPSVAKPKANRQPPTARHEFYTLANTMDKIKNGDPVLYKNLKGTIYGKPRESKYKGLLYTVKIGDDYIKASASELTPNADELHPNEIQLFTEQERR